LPVEQALAQGMKREAQRPDFAVEVGAQELLEELVEPLGLPVAIHVALAKAQAAQGKDALRDIRVDQSDIPGTIAADPDIGLLEQLDKEPVQAGFIAAVSLAGPDRG
jgi:hypothetical protein